MVEKLNDYERHFNYNLNGSLFLLMTQKYQKSLDLNIINSLFYKKQGFLHKSGFFTYFVEWLS